jgi:hypothetical protein
MEQNILNALQGLDGEVKGTNVSAGISFEFGGCIKLERGNFSMQISFYAKVYETKHKGIVSIDDWDIHDTHDYVLGGLPIDNISAFKTKLTEWGVGRIGEKLKFTTDEEKRAIAMAMQEDESLKKLYGKKFKVLDLLSKDEQNLLDLQYIVANFESCGNYLKENVAKHYNLGVQPTTPTLEEFEQKLVELTK